MPESELTSHQRRRLEALCDGLNWDHSEEGFFSGSAQVSDQVFAVMSYAILAGRYPDNDELREANLRLLSLERNQLFHMLAPICEESDSLVEIIKEPILFDLTHTIGYGWLSGIQRVVREVAKRLSVEEKFCGIVFVGDGFIKLSRARLSGFLENEKKFVKSSNRKLKVTRMRKAIRAFARSWFPPALLIAALEMRSSLSSKREKGKKDGSRCLILPIGGRMILGELLDMKRAAFYDAILAMVNQSGAIVYDMIPLTHPRFCDPNIVKNHAFYIESLSKFNVLWPISETAGVETVKLLAGEGFNVNPICLPATMSSDGDDAMGEKNLPGQNSKELLYVSTLDPRKNHFRLLLACESLWSEGESFTLRLIGGKGWRNEGLLRFVDELKAKG
ncbi:MAG: hypothetical protein AAF558_13980, partial [Verrucomicrobiota bacterium]